MEEYGKSGFLLQMCEEDHLMCHLGEKGHLVIPKQLLRLDRSPLFQIA